MCVFDIRTIHASTENCTSRFRISMDTRWQPARFVPDTTRTLFSRLEVAGFDENGRTTQTASLNAEAADQKTATAAAASVQTSGDQTTVTLTNQQAPAVTTAASNAALSRSESTPTATSAASVVLASSG